MTQTLIGRFVENQAQELIIRKEELEIRKQEIDRGFAHAELLLEAQKEDRKLTVESNLIAGKRALIVVLVFMLLLAAGIGFCLYLNKDQLLLELAKYIGALLAGGLGGYSIRTIKDKQNGSNQ